MSGIGICASRILPQFYVLFHSIDASGALRRKPEQRCLCAHRSLPPLTRVRPSAGSPRARPEFRVSRIRTQLEINRSHTVREAAAGDAGVVLAICCAVARGRRPLRCAALLRLQRRREIGIRIAVGAQARRHRAISDRGRVFHGVFRISAGVGLG